MLTKEMQECLWDEGSGEYQGRHQEMVVGALNQLLEDVSILSRSMRVGVRYRMDEPG